MSLSSELVGQTLGGYELVSVIGSGAMATVFKAYQPTLDRWVAVKVLQYKDPNAIARFQREAKAVALLRHRNILIIYEYGEERNWPFIVMEYVDGGTLNDQLKGQPLDLTYSINLLISVADALTYAHSQGITHRDVKPSNILLPQPDWPILADFGLVKINTKAYQQEALTRSGVSIGTPAYLAPEQARGSKIDHRADIYALSVILYEMVSGRLPFDYDNPNKMLLAHISEPLPAPSRFNPNLPPTLETVIVTALDKDPDRRYQTMRQFMEALKNLELSPTIRRARSRTTALPPVQSNPTETINTSRPAFQEHLKGASAATGAPRQQARILLTDRGVTLPVPDKSPVIIGRTHRDKIADIDLGPHGGAQSGISRHHARLARQGNQWIIDDLVSLNGTYINDVKVQPGHSMPLKNGDVVRCSHMSFVFLISSE